MKSSKPILPNSPRRPGPLALVVLGTAIACLAVLAIDATFNLRGRLATPLDPVTQAWERDGRFFVEGKGGALVTNHPNMPPATFPTIKASDEFRVVVLGGSQAMGDPYVHGRRELAGLDLDELNITNSGGLATWLETYLERIYPDRTIRVVNAAMGDRDLATVRAAFEEFTARSSADLAVILAGNNEIFQASFASPSDRDLAVEQISTRFEQELERILKVAETSKIPTYLLTVPTNLRDWLPSYSHQTVAKTEIDALLDQRSSPRPRDQGAEVEFTENGLPVEVERRLSEASHALLDFFAGRASEERGEFEEAYLAYTRAKDRDYNLIRTHSRWNDAVRRVEGANVHVFDLEKALRKHARNGIPGFDLFHDHCHMKLRANMLVAREIAGFHSSRLDRNNPALLQLPMLDVTETLRSQLDSLYAIKVGKWQRINENSQFEQLGDRNKQNVEKQFEASKAELSFLEETIERYESELEVNE